MDTATAALKNANVKTLVKYVNGESLKNIPDTFSSTTKSGAQSAGFFSALPFVKFLRNKKLAGEATKQLNEKLVAGDKAMLESFKQIFKKDGVKISQKIADYSNLVDANAAVYSEIKSATNAAGKATKAIIKNNKIVNKAAKGSKSRLVQWVRNFKASRATAKAEKLTAKALDKISAVTEQSSTKALTVAANTGKAAGKLGKFGKFIKTSGAGFMLVLSGISEAFTEVIPTFKELGKEKGMKQIGKSAVRVVGDTAGYIAGAAAGKLAGAAIGAKIGAVAGSVVPGIGNVIGAGVGLVCGLLGSFIAGKITKKITGPSEREIAKQQQQQETTQQIINDKESLDALKAAAALKIQEEAEANGKLSEDSLIALEALENMGNNIFAA